jgi:hypothetical protein
MSSLPLTKTLASFFNKYHAQAEQQSETGPFFADLVLKIINAGIL